MTGGERAQILLTARLLEAASKLDLLSTGLTLIAVASLVFMEPGIAAIAAVMLGLIAKFYNVRIAFDARLLNDVATSALTMEALDEAFPAKAGRSWADRCRGASRLVTASVVITLAQCAALVLT